MLRHLAQIRGPLQQERPASSDRQGSLAPCGFGAISSKRNVLQNLSLRFAPFVLPFFRYGSRVHARSIQSPASLRARLKTLSSMGRVSLPVLVFCSEG